MKLLSEEKLERTDDPVTLRQTGEQGVFQDFHVSPQTPCCPTSITNSPSSNEHMPSHAYGSLATHTRSWSIDSGAHSYPLGRATSHSPRNLSLYRPASRLS